MYSKNIVVVFITIFLVNSCLSQTVGTLFNSSESSQSFTLISPISSKNTYLIDICGGIVNQWKSDFAAGLASYLDQDGNLYRAGRVPSPIFFGGGIGGVIEKFNWQGELIWQLDMANDNFHQHHDFAVMPNGNILVVCWEYISTDEAIKNGRNPNFIGDGVWSTLILEMEHDGNDQFNKVWEWHAWDHIIQSFDATRLNYGFASVKRRKINVNIVDENLPKLEDWLHMNSIDYNLELDQIVLSSRNLSELFIIDHSTTIEESKGSTGGIRGFGGDLLYRFGNKNNFLSGGDKEKILSSQHDANWIAEGRPGQGNILLFNNKPTNSIGNSEVLEFNFEGMNGDYNIGSNSSYASRLVWDYNMDSTQNLYSLSMSGCERLSNGNTLIISGLNGTLIEAAPNQEMNWKYVVPVNGQGPITQFDDPSGNSIFKARSYSKSFFNFQLDYETFPKIEINPTDDCVNFNVASSVQDEISKNRPILKKVENGFELEGLEDGSYSFSVVNVMGQLVFYESDIQEQYIFDDFELSNGLYIILLHKKNEIIAFLKFLK